MSYQSNEGAWHPDPAGRCELRWHDGRTWTEHVRRGEETGVNGLEPADPSGSRLKGLAGSALAKGRERRDSKKEAAAEATPSAEPEGSSGMPDGAILQVASHDEGRNATVTVCQNRIERVKARAFGSISRARQDTEVTPIKSVSSVQATKDGFRTKVTLFASGNTIDLCVSHDEARRPSEAVMQLILEPTLTAPAPAAAPTARPPANGSEGSHGPRGRRLVAAGGPGQK